MEPRDDRARPARRARGEWGRRRGARGRRGGARRGAREPGDEKYREYARTVNEDAARKATLRGLLEVGGGKGPRGEAIPLEEVEAAKEIVGASAPAR